ncbi:uncharacterized protein [Nicotiana tomentosiformis]|uniref:uncharacterized protein n=1 Tax=Nicotiana tomentosiformis TaxID=4098 RepID=UPI00051C044B|nr:uncharacterized protein LOC104095018 [Nicotiana tomentosiformis]
MPALPFPQKMKREKLDNCFGRFLEMLKQPSVNIPFTEVLAQMPDYAKFLKEILSSKRKLEETTVVKLNTTAVPYCKTKFSKSVGTQEASPYHARRGVKCFTRPSMIQTTILPKGIIEDILVWVKKFVFPVYFIVVDMEVNKEVPLILGWPFLCTGRAILDIYEGQLMLRVGTEKVVLQMKRMMKYPSNEVSSYSCFKLDVIGELDEKYKFDKLVGDTLKRCITQSSTVDDEDSEIKKEAEALET